jgi:hypothetical protein
MTGSCSLEDPTYVRMLGDKIQSVDVKLLAVSNFRIGHHKAKLTKKPMIEYGKVWMVFKARGS